MSEVYAFIEAEKTTHKVALLCRLPKVARSSFYAWSADEQARADHRAADDAPAHEITGLHIASRCTYGVPRIHPELRRLDRRVNRKPVERIMHERDIARVTRRKRRSLTRPAKRAAPAADLIGRDFTARAPGRKPVGHSMTDHHRTCLAVDALTMATERDRLQPSRIAHSDRGSEYTSDELHQEIRRLGLRQNMGRTGSY
ncbi:IS3 family transposase [Streptomyces sp. NPDC056352]|uniref:IS3 family transposase n=1 Tax=Streptomyces sp. NPDC056352 TaxID=3345791 RepID=UPI0035DF6BBF